MSNTPSAYGQTIQSHSPLYGSRQERCPSSTAQEDNSYEDDKSLDSTLAMREHRSFRVAHNSNPGLGNLQSGDPASSAPGTIWIYRSHNESWGSVDLYPGQAKPSAAYSNRGQPQRQRVCKPVLPAIPTNPIYSYRRSTKDGYSSSKSTMPSLIANEIIFSAAKPILRGILQTADFETTQFHQREASSYEVTVRMAKVFSTRRLKVCRGQRDREYRSLIPLHRFTKKGVEMQTHGPSLYRPLKTQNLDDTSIPTTGDRARRRKAKVP